MQLTAVKDRHELWDPKMTYIIGHQRPDMDAIASALGYAWFLRETGEQGIVAARAGQVGSQSAFALGYFGQKPPRVLSSAAPTFAHVAERQIPVSPDDPLSEAMNRLALGERLVPVVDWEHRLLGGLSTHVLARAYVQVATGEMTTRAQKCGDFVEALPTLQATDRISDHRRALLRSDGDDFLVVEANQRYLGITSRRCLLDPPRARLILVDHNELSQAVSGAEEAEIIGVLDHHRLGNAPTASPIPFVIEPVGCTCTLVTECCQRAHVAPPSNIAGVLLSGILSDTLVFRSPTTTDRDRQAAEWLAKLCKVDITEYGQDLIHASPGLADRSADDIVDADRKPYEMAGKAVSVAQVEVAGFDEIPDRMADLLNALETRRDREVLALICLMVTDVITVQSRLLCAGDEAILTNLPFSHLSRAEFDLGSVVSRKKQVVPALESVMEELYGS